MTPPTEDKLQSRIDMREEAEEAITKCAEHWEDDKDADLARFANHLLTLLDEIEELETTIATQACDVAEYQRKKEKPANPNYKYVAFSEVMQEGDEYLSSTLGDWITIEMESVGWQLANAGCVMRRKVRS